MFTTVEVKQLFGQLGKIISCRILHCKETGLSRGVAFVRYDTRGEAELAVKTLNQTVPIKGHPETITVKVVFNFYLKNTTNQKIYRRKCVAFLAYRTVGFLGVQNSYLSARWHF